MSQLSKLSGREVVSRVPRKKVKKEFKAKPLLAYLPAEPTKFKVKPRLKSKQRAVTALEKSVWDRMAKHGCVACRMDGIYNPHGSIHHIDGRTKPDCHKRVLFLCAGHHQDGTGADKTLIAVHPNKARFESRYWPQDTLLEVTLLELDLNEDFTPIEFLK